MRRELVPSCQTHPHHVAPAPLPSRRDQGQGGGNRGYPVVARPREACDMPQLRADRFRPSPSVPLVPEKLMRYPSSALTGFASRPICPLPPRSL